MEKENIKIIVSEVIDAECALRWIDRIRILFGSRLFVTTVVHLPRRIKIKTQTKYGVEKVFYKLPSDHKTEQAQQELPA